MPKVRLLDPWLIGILDKHFPYYLPMPDFCAAEDYHSPEVIVCAFRTYRLHNVYTVNTVPNFVTVLERLEKECMEGAKKMMKDFNSIDFELFEFPDSGRGCLFWNCYLASLLHTDAVVSMTDEGLITPTGDSCEGRLVSLKHCSGRGMMFEFAIKSRRGVVCKTLQWRDLLGLSSLGIVFRDQISINLSMMDKPTLYDSVEESATMGKKHNKKSVMKEKSGIDGEGLAQRLEHMNDFEQEKTATLTAEDDRISSFTEIETEGYWETILIRHETDFFFIENGHVLSAEHTLFS